MAPEPTCIAYFPRPSSPEETVPSNKSCSRRRRYRKRSSQEILPVSSAYYTMSVSKAKILNQMKEKVASGETYIYQYSAQNRSQKKVDLIWSIRSKINELKNIKCLLASESLENECLGTQVCELSTRVCTPREQEKYNNFVQDIDKIFHLLLSLSGRLTRVENAIQMLPSNEENEEKELLYRKQASLAEQYNDAKQLKENIDRRQISVSKILSRYFNKAEFADFEHYIKMKTALVVEQRELDDKVRLGEEQMFCLKESLPDNWQIKLEKMMKEEE